MEEDTYRTGDNQEYWGDGQECREAEAPGCYRVRADGITECEMGGRAQWRLHRTYGSSDARR